MHISHLSSSKVLSVGDDVGNGPLAETHSRTAPKLRLPWATPTLDAWNPSTASTEHR